MSLDQNPLNIANNQEQKETEQQQDYIIYSKLTHHDSQFSKGKKKQRLPEVDPTLVNITCHYYNQN